MRAGRLRHRVVIERVSETPDAYGERSETWNTFATRWASVEPLSGREFFAVQTENTEISLRVRLRHDDTVDGITTKDRITWNGRVFDIDSIINVMERDRELQLMCIERT